MNANEPGYQGKYNPFNPHELTLGKFLRGRERPVNAHTKHRFGIGYARLNNGQIVRSDTLAHLRYMKGKV